MFKVSDRFALLFFSMTGVFNFKYENNVLKLSKFVMVYNIVATPLAAIFFYLLMTSSFLQDIVFDNEKIGFDQISRFTLGLMIFDNFFIHFASLGSCVVQLWKRNYVFKFLNEVNELHSFLDDGLKEVFQKHATRNTLIASFLCTTYVLVQFSTCKISAVTFVFSFLLSRPYLLAYGYLAFIKTFEAFLVVLLQDFDMKLKKFLETTEFNLEDCQRLMTNHQRVHRLSEEFNSNFGFPMTMFTCFYTCITTLHVRIF